MAYNEAKIYFDGSHYVAIPHTTREQKIRKKPSERMVKVTEDLKLAEEPENKELSISDYISMGFIPVEINENIFDESESIPETDKLPNEFEAPKMTRQMTRKQVFDEWYVKTSNLKYKERFKLISEAMRSFFDDDKATELFVQINFERKKRNLIMRRIRMTRKAALQDFNYFCTFTYDDKKHTEDSFKKQLRTCFRHFCSRRGWKYIGVWERSPEKKRLHFHGVFYIPDGTMPEYCIEQKDYSFRSHKHELIHQNTYFLRRFGRNDMEAIADRERTGEALAYLMKYIDKSGEKIVYSGGLPQYFISDILDDDILCKIQKDDRPEKLVLYDKFSCFDEGVYMGEVSPETIAQLRKIN